MDRIVKSDILHAIKYGVIGGIVLASILFGLLLWLAPATI